MPTISTWLEVEDAFHQGLKWVFYGGFAIPSAIEAIAFMSRDAFARAAEEDKAAGR